MYGFLDFLMGQSLPPCWIITATEEEAGKGPMTQRPVHGKVNRTDSHECPSITGALSNINSFSLEKQPKATKTERR